MTMQVYALKKINLQNQFEGYLLFANEIKCAFFIKLATASVEKSGHYETVGLVEVGEFFYKKTQENSSFFTKNLIYNT